MRVTADNESRGIRWSVLLAVGLLGVVAFLVMTQPWRSKTAAAADPGELAQVADPEPVAGQPANSPASPDEKWGIQVTGLHLAVGGRMLDLRYRVLDPNRAALWLKQQDETTCLVDPVSGKKVPLPDALRSGSLHRAASELAGGHTYFMYFPNPGQQFEKGSKVTLVMGNFRAENLTVE